MTGWWCYVVDVTGTVRRHRSFNQIDERRCWCQRWCFLCSFRSAFDRGYCRWFLERSFCFFCWRTRSWLLFLGHLVWCGGRCFPFTYSSLRYSRRELYWICLDILCYKTARPSERHLQREYDQQFLLLVLVRTHLSPSCRCTKRALYHHRYRRPGHDVSRRGKLGSRVPRDLLTKPMRTTRR